MLSTFNKWHEQDNDNITKVSTLKKKRHDRIQLDLYSTLSWYSFSGEKHRHAEESCSTQHMYLHRSFIQRHSSLHRQQAGYEVLLNEKQNHLRSGVHA